MRQRKKHKPKTTIDLRRHAIKRAAKRYGIFLSHEDYEALVLQIEGGESTFLLRESNTKVHHFVNQIFIAVYDTKRRAIVTFLPPDCIWNYLPLAE